MNTTPDFSPLPDTSEPDPINPTSSRFITAVVLAALVFSGVAAIINQTIWQRSLKVYLAGSEAISSMIVVLVFMLGLGLGSYHMSFRASKIRNPLLAIGIVEVGLMLVNLIICALLSTNVAESAIALQQAAVAMGIPLRILYAIVSTVTLLIPCYLMGITMPLVSETAQRQLHKKDSQFLNILFLLNTLGAVAGALISGFYLLPYIGQRSSLIVASVLNGVAGVMLLGILYKVRVNSVQESPGLSLVSSAKNSASSAANFLYRHPQATGFALGFLALSYEMYLFRIAALTYLPLPYTFATVLSLYLLLWTIGLAMAKSLKGNLALVLAVTGFMIMLVPQVATLQYNEVTAVLALLPCVGFGIAFGLVIAETSHNWGTDVARFYFMNTIGSSLGILAATIVGFHFHPMFLAWFIGLMYVGMAVMSRSGRAVRQPVWAKIGLVAFASIWLPVGWLLLGDLAQSKRADSPFRMYFSPEGVIEVRNGKALFWDGLWHSDLSKGDHVGTNNWLLGIIPFLSHDKAENSDVLVIGLGTGITVETLARFPEVEHVDAYEINETLKELLADFPAGTLNVADDPKVHITWGDGRTGMALNEKKYDIVTQQPMYLKQAGSSILLSREYMQLVQKRLKPGGVYTIYCNSLGNKAQASVVRSTAASVFPYCESFGNGYMLVVSDSPISFSRDKVEKIVSSLPEDSVIRGELEQFGVDALVDYFDRPALNWNVSPYMVTDDRPLVEYPGVATSLVSGYKNSQRK